jgi:hypothetical protein
MNTLSVQPIPVYKFSCAVCAKGYNQKEFHYMNFDFCTTKCLSIQRCLHSEEKNKINPPINNKKGGRIEYYGGGF